ncbi:hypothetical protein DN820_08470 [Stutzerimonas nosocomialis]|uniref:GmrSD restriction endonucleases N-terminal domain-containing protein n=1 Tax=Stutzerimonas nosocomialis TaxID=1056496 RepID=A0A5R9QGQ5_9GAMM|nr:DUF262 domain-containing protein [Stutzerimonas nosocomialis]TLX64033.1 hypothetical protein DN820_08470 [Stutzerimonas nosocomialis]
MQEPQDKALNLYPIDYPFETLYNRVKSKKLILNPDFQRKYKWDKDGWERSSKFIESCLMRIPLPSCYFAEEDDGTHLVIDGVQRITTIQRFFDDEFSLEGLTTFKDLEGKKFSDLGKYKSELESTTIRCIVLRKENPKNLISEIFSRLNQGAVELSDQEVRHALYPGPLDKLLEKLGEIEEIKNFGMGPKSEKDKNNLEAQEQVLRFFALKGDLTDYEDKLSKYLDNYMEKHQNLTLKETKSYATEFTEALDKCKTVFGKDIFIDTNKQRRRQSMVYYDLLMHSLAPVEINTVREKKENIKKAFTELCRNKDFQKSLSGGLQNKASILKRRALWESLLEKAIHGRR